MQPDVQVTSGNQLGDLQRWIALKLVEHDGDGVTEGLSEESAAQMPHVSGPHTLDPVAVNELAEHRLYASADASESHGPLWVWVATGMFERGLKVHLNISQLLSESGTPVVAVSQHSAGASTDQLR